MTTSCYTWQLRERYHALFFTMVLLETEKHRPLYDIADRSGAGAEDITAILKEADGSITGGVSAYLSDIFLPSYLAKLKGEHEESEYFDQIPDVVEQVLLPIVNAPGIEEVELHGSVARFIAHGMSEEYWEVLNYFDYLKREAHSDRVKYFLGGPFGFAADPDFDIGIRGISVEKLSSSLEDWFKVSDFRDAPFVHAGKQIVRKEYAFTLKTGHRVEISVGPIPTVPDIHNLVISIFDIRTDQRVFHIDINEAPAIAEQVEREKRQGKTNRKQDEVRAALFTENNRLWYEVSPEAVEIMKGQDEVTTESTDLAEIAEISLRALRMNLLHENPTFVDLRFFLLQFTDVSLFALQERIQAAILRGERISEQVLPILKRELALCLTIDPYVTIQALRDMGLATIIPGLRSITGEQWQKVLHSRHLAIAADATPEAARSDTYMNWQREYYRRGHPKEHIPRSYDGVKRFIRALEDIGVVYKNGDCWEQYMDVWETKKQSSIQLGDQGLFAPERVDGYRSLATVGDIAIFTLTPPSSIAEDVVLLEHLALKLMERLPEPSLEFRALRAAATIRQTLSETEIQEFGEEYLIKMGLVYALLEQFAAGLTPRQMKRLCAQVDPTSAVPEKFENVFLDLKLCGLVGKRKIQRIDRNGEAQDVEFYSLLQQHYGPIEDYTHRDDFLKIYHNVLLDDYEISKSPSRFPDYYHLRGTLKRRVNMLERVGISSVDVLAALSDKDWEVLQKRTSHYKSVDTTTKRNAGPILMTCMKIIEETQ